MGKYPVISISLKGMDALTYETAFQMAVQIVIEAAEKFYFLLDSEKLKEHDKAEYRKLLDDHMNEGMACSSLRKLSGLLEKHYGTKAVLLIDEYDVLNYCDSLFDDREAQPENYWINTSGNDAVKQFIQESSNVSVKREIERLVAGEAVTKEIHQYPGYGCKKRNEGKFLSWYFAWNPWGEGPLGGPSNWEMGEGYADILAEPDTGDMGIILEVKYAHDRNLDAACKAALEQIEHTGYEDDLEDERVKSILKYGIACYKKRCKVMLAET